MMVLYAFVAAMLLLVGLCMVIPPCRAGLFQGMTELRGYSRRERLTCTPVLCLLFPLTYLFVLSFFPALLLFGWVKYWILVLFGWRRKPKKKKKEKHYDDFESKLPIRSIRTTRISASRGSSRRMPSRFLMN